jgi:TM2 domain-containing membrane protein YozV
VCRFCQRPLAAGVPLASQATVNKSWSPGVAAVLSFFIPGLGQIYKGRVGLGIGLFVLTAIGYAALILPGIAIHIGVIINAYEGRDGAAVEAALVGVPPSAESEATRLAERKGNLRAVAFIGGLLFVAVLLGLLLRPETQRSTSASPGAPAVESRTRTEYSGEVVTANLLLNAYEENAVAADDRFKAKAIAISGTIDSIGKDILDTPYVMFDGRGVWGVQALFAKSQKAAVADLRKGQFVSLRCQGGGKLLNVLLRDCVLR